MLLEPTINGLKSLKLFGMLRALETQLENPDSRDLSFEERIGLLIDSEVTSRDDRKLQCRLKQAKFPQMVMLENIDSKGNRGVSKAELAVLANCDWVLRKQNVLLTGPTGVGKSYLACALAHKACREGFSAFFIRTSHLFQELAIARADGRYAAVLSSYARKEVLIIDDFGLFPLSEEQRQDLLEILDDRYQKSSTIITSQFLHEHWHQIIGDPTIADAILDRVVHNSYKLQLKGESRRKPQKGESLQLVG
jgi:DNA replication protein DnaC